MARPKKIGLDYFPLDVHLEDKVELLEAEHGLIGFAILIKLWQKIYSEGYYISWNTDNALLFARKNNTDITIVNSVVNTCLLRNIFDNSLYKQYEVLTSNGIQLRYDKVCTDAKRKHISYRKELLLIKTEFTTDLPTFTTEISTQSKVKESKVNKSKASNDIYRSFKHLSITKIDNQKLVDKYGSQEVVDDVYDSIENFAKNKNYSSLYLTANKWLKKASDKTDRKVVDF